MLSKSEYYENDEDIQCRRAKIEKQCKRGTISRGAKTILRGKTDEEDVAGGGGIDRTDRSRESLPRSHVLYKTQSLHRCRRHRQNGENAYVCTLAQRRGQTSRNICFPSQYSAEERLQPINPRGNELFSPISLTGARATASSQFSICLPSPSTLVSYSRRSIFLLQSVIHDQ